MPTMSDSRPTIGVTGEDGHIATAWWFIRWALRRAGANAIRLTPGRGVIPTHLDGIVISGGDDIDQSLYLPVNDEKAPVNPARDRFEVMALEKLLPRNLPVLGICRGAQLLNVVLGGSLHPELSSLRKLTSNKRVLLPRKVLKVEPASQLQEILGTDECHINSLHHQAIDRLGDGMTISGRDLDGIVQAVENPEHPFRLGVQWHPEYLPQLSQQGALFRRLVKVASA
ncbi:gamma-glutamyl-gamma-aminobutyrate hydrolase family protein [Spongiibacter thalassae]|nr:gamma-glutamyl-gamma-aminobutyrate hydrolase family protein [Spongiibacter thalassae]